MKQPSYYLNLESKKTKSGERLIYLNLTYGYKESGGKYIPMRISTKWRIKPDQWDKKNKRPFESYKRSKGKDLEDAIERIRKISFDLLSIYRNQHKVDPHPKILKELVQIELGRKKAKEEHNILTEYIQSQIDKRTQLPPSNKLHWKEGSAKQYKTLIKHIQDYQTERKIILTIETLSEEQYWDFFQTISDLRFKEVGKGQKVNTISKTCSKLRSILNLAIDSGIIVGFNFNKKGMKIGEVDAKHDTYLNEAQLTRIIREDTCHSAEFTHAKNYLIISSLTGLRLDDMKHLHKVKVETMMSQGVEFSGFYTIVRKSESNGVNMVVAIPILKPVADILIENNGQFPPFPAPSNVRGDIRKFLKHLKFNNDVLVTHRYYGYEDIDELLPQHQVFIPHDCRRTFITNLKQLGIHNETIEPITHPKVKNSSIIDKYDKSNLMDKAFSLLKSIYGVDSLIYHR